MEIALYEASRINYDSVAELKGVKLKLRLLDGHFYDDVYFKASLNELIEVIEKGQMLYIEKVNGDQIFINSRLVVDFVLS